MRSISKSRIAKLSKEGRGLRGTFAAKTMSENQLQQAVARLLDHSGLVWCHPPNGGNRTARTGALMKSMGAKAGVPDVLIFNGVLSTLLQSWVGMAIELKVGKNKPTPAQLKWHEDLRRCGWRVDVCRTVDEVLAVLRECYPNKFKP
ncbi:MAG: hypothetical protein E6Q97_04545 [Desulfurellales bacterium]|nr:MAG: hypothetical protein E6Q97_04545 [Desulfurellales bacterium]